MNTRTHRHVQPTPGLAPWEQLEMFNRDDPLRIVDLLNEWRETYEPIRDAQTPPAPAGRGEPCSRGNRRVTPAKAS